ncbi:MAG: hypothetical protein AAGA60_18155, partial [Cyanobacteria bacterium P01_E01_bin.42]
LIAFVKAICQALADLFSYHKIKLMTENNQAKKVGEIRHWMDQIKVARLKASNCTISIKSKAFLVNYENSICKAIKIQNIRDENKIDKEELEITIEQEIELKLIVKPEEKIKKKWQIYIIKD